MRALAVLAALLALALAASPARADFEAGMRAANQRDYAGALRAWRPLSEAGEARAQYHLGLLYEEGRGVGRDYAAAARWCRAAAVQGHAPAQNALAILIVQGQGAARDPVEAYRWFALAAKGGDGFAGRNPARLRAMLSAAEIAEGEARAAQPLSGSE